MKKDERKPLKEREEQETSSLSQPKEIIIKIKLQDITNLLLDEYNCRAFNMCNMCLKQNNCLYLKYREKINKIIKENNLPKELLLF